MPEAAKRSDIEFTKPALQNPGMVLEHRGEWIHILKW